MSTPGERQAISNLQDVFLNGARRERLRVTVRLMDGTEVRGRIKSFDRYALLVEHEESDVLLFKHAVATIRPHVGGGSHAGAGPQSGAGPSDSGPGPGARRDAAGGPHAGAED